MPEEHAKDPVAQLGRCRRTPRSARSRASSPGPKVPYNSSAAVTAIKQGDMVLDHASGAVIGIEVKAAESVRAEDFRGLRHLAGRLGERFRAGIVLYAAGN